MYQIEILRYGMVDQALFAFGRVDAQGIIGRFWTFDCYVRVFHNGQLLRYLEVEELALTSGLAVYGSET